MAHGKQILPYLRSKHGDVSALTSDDKLLGQAVLSRLCSGGQIGGIRFGPILQVLIDHRNPEPHVQGQVYLNLESTWIVFEHPPSFWPICEEDIVEPPMEERLNTLCGLREATITEVVLGKDQPHLTFKFEDGRLLFINGKHNQYECWEVGVYNGDPAESWLVVACPGEQLAVWAPSGFLN
jgi:hypothetical protein